MIVYGRNSVEEALNDNLEMQYIAVEIGRDGKFPHILKLAKERGIDIRHHPGLMLEKEAKTRKHQGIIAEVKMPENIVETVEEPVDWSQYHTILLLDGITDTGNLGAIIRSALLFDFGAIVLPHDNSARITPATIKASAGGVYHQPVIYVNNINTFAEELKALEFNLYALTGHTRTTFEDVDLQSHLCLVIGSERKGIRKSLRKLCDERIAIPTTGKLDSLNASVAAAVAMWEVYRNRQ